MERYAVIMAGGSGTRLWPISRETRPKQFIKVDKGGCMLVRTIERMCRIVSPDHCYIVTSESLKDITEQAVKELIPLTNIIIEPQRKNTAACIAYAAILLKKKFGEGLLCFVPADGYVKDSDGYKEAIELAYDTAENTRTLVVVGITPTYPAVGYGYIQIDKDSGMDERVLIVQKFIEKPNLETAQKLITSGEYLWNGGILAGSMEAINESIKTFLPEHEKRLSEAISHVEDIDGNTYIQDAYNKIQNISFDKGVLEKINCIYVIRGFFDWDDIGSIDALTKTLITDAKGNVSNDTFFGIDTSNSIIYGEDILITTIGVTDLIIAGTKDAIIVCPKDRAQEVKDLVEKLKKEGYRQLL